MERIEAIKILEEVKVNNDGMSQYIEGYDEAFEKAIDSLKKQIPKKPIVWIEDNAVVFANCRWNLVELFEIFEYEDGSPCGKLVEECSM